MQCVRACALALVLLDAGARGVIVEPAALYLLGGSTEEDALRLRTHDGALDSLSWSLRGCPVAAAAGGVSACPAPAAPKVCSGVCAGDADSFSCAWRNASGGGEPLVCESCCEGGQTCCVNEYFQRAVCCEGAQHCCTGGCAASRAQCCGYLVCRPDEECNYPAFACCAVGRSCGAGCCRVAERCFEGACVPECAYAGVDLSPLASSNLGTDLVLEFAAESRTDLVFLNLCGPVMTPIGTCDGSGSMCMLRSDLLPGASRTLMTFPPTAWVEGGALHLHRSPVGFNEWLVHIILKCSESITVYDYEYHPSMNPPELTLNFFTPVMCGQEPAQTDGSGDDSHLIPVVVVLAVLAFLSVFVAPYFSWRYYRAKTNPMVQLHPSPDPSPQNGASPTTGAEGLEMRKVGP
ncbi:hypothetical protein DIPPA_01784 [Diplonema papillatum]|nr:hypothetical protein DIPPA_01784 [Diplonema papillatum]